MCNQLVEFVEHEDAILRSYPYIPGMVGWRTPEIFYFQIFGEIAQSIALYVVNEEIIIGIE